MLQRHQLEIDSLHPRPHHPILLQRRRIRARQLIPGTRPLHDRHTAQKNEEVRRGEEDLIGENARRTGGVGILKDNLVLQELEPSCCDGAKDGLEWSK